MRRAIAHARNGDWPASKAIDSVTLDFDARHRRRYRLQTDGGTEVLLDLDSAVSIADGDGLQLEDNYWLYVQAGDEALTEITTNDFGHLARVAWHLGNRHLPAAISADRILIRPDHVIESMLIGLHAKVRPVNEPFQPEHGAYHNYPHSSLGAIS